MADFWDSEELLGKMSKNSKEEIHVKKVKKSGRTYIDIRVFWLDANTDEFKPSQKGLAIPFESIDDFKSILDKIE